jgi:hypothetical protein
VSPWCTRSVRRLSSERGMDAVAAVRRQSRRRHGPTLADLTDHVGRSVLGPRSAGATGRSAGVVLENVRTGPVAVAADSKRTVIRPCRPPDPPSAVLRVDHVGARSWRRLAGLVRVLIAGSASGGRLARRWPARRRRRCRHACHATRRRGRPESSPPAGHPDTQQPNAAGGVGLAQQSHRQGSHDPGVVGGRRQAQGMCRGGEVPQTYLQGHGGVPTAAPPAAGPRPAGHPLGDRCQQGGVDEVGLEGVSTDTDFVSRSGLTGRESTAWAIAARDSPCARPSSRPARRPAGRRARPRCARPAGATGCGWPGRRPAGPRPPAERAAPVPSRSAPAPVRRACPGRWRSWPPAWTSPLRPTRSDRR